MPFEEAIEAYCETLLDHYNWHFSIGPYRAEAAEVPAEVEIEVEVPEDAGPAASASLEVFREGTFWVNSLLC